MNIKYMLFSVVIIDCCQAASNFPQLPQGQSSIYSEENVRRFATDIIGMYLANSYNASKSLCSDKIYQNQKRMKYIKSYKSIFKTEDGKTFFRAPNKYPQLWSAVKRSINFILKNRGDNFVLNLTYDINTKWNLRKAFWTPNIVEIQLTSLITTTSDVAAKITGTLHDLFEQRKNYGNLKKRLQHICADLHELEQPSLVEEKQLDIISQVNKNIDSLRHSRGSELLNHYDLIKKIDPIGQKLPKLSHCSSISKQLTALQKRIDTVSKKAQSGTDQKSLNKKTKGEKKPKKVQ